MKRAPKFTVRNVLNWLNEQPKRRKFDYGDNRNCVFASFAKEALGYEDVSCGGWDIYLDGTNYLLPDKIKQVIHKVRNSGNLTVGRLINGLSKLN